MLGDDRLAQALEREPRRRGDEPLVALLERAQQPRVALVELRRQLALEPGEERPAARRPAQQHEAVVREPDERRREHGDERLVVVAVVQQPQVREQVDDLLLAEVAAAGRAVGRQAEAAQLLLVPLGVRPGREQQHDLARRGGAGVDQLAHAPRDVLGLRAAPVRAACRRRRSCR